MTMFKELYGLATSAALTMVISADEKTGRMTINVVPKPKKDVDEPALTKAVKPAPQAAAPKASVKAQTDTADDLGDDDAGAAGRAPQPSAATTADSASYDLFG